MEISGVGCVDFGCEEVVWGVDLRTSVFGEGGREGAQVLGHCGVSDFGCDSGFPSVLVRILCLILI